MKNAVRVMPVDTRTRLLYVLTGIALATTLSCSKRTEAETTTLSNEDVTVLCDQTTGNLLYLFRSGMAGSLAVLPGGCARSS